MIKRYDPDWQITLVFVSILITLILGVTEIKAQSNTCNNGDALVVNTGGNKNNQCIPLNQQPAGTGTTMLIANAGVTGTTLNKFAKLTGAPSTAVISSNGDTENAIGIVTAGAGTTGMATITIMGQVSCVFDGATTANDYVTIAATGGGCHSAGATYPTGTTVYGKVFSTNGGAGTYVMELMTPDITGSAATSGNGKNKPGTPANSYQYNSSNVFTGGILEQTASDSVKLNIAAAKLIFGTEGQPPFITINTSCATGQHCLELRNALGIVPGFDLRRPFHDQGGGAYYNLTDTNLTVGSSATIGFAGTSFTGSPTAFFDTVNGTNPGQILVKSSTGDGGGTLAFGSQTQAQITANQNDYTLSGMGYLVRLSTNASRNITGIRDPNAPLNGRQQDGEIKRFFNIGSNLTILTNQDANSTDTNRILSASGGDIYVAPNQFADCVYDDITQRWRCYNPAPLTASSTLDFGNLAAIGCEDLTITVTGAASGDVVSLGVPNGSVVNNSSYSAWVSAADTVTVRFCALISGDPASGTFRVDVWKH